MVGHLQQTGGTVLGSTANTRAGADAQAFRQGPHAPHQQVGRDALAMERRAVRLQKIPLTGTEHNWRRPRRCPLALRLPKSIQPR